jgi:molecular chaperone DnaK (HSP70)
LDAASVADFRVLQLMHEPSAVALQYGLTKHKFLKEQADPYNVLFYDMGAQTVKVAIATYVNQTGKNNEFLGSFSIRGNGWNANLGGLDFDQRLASHFAAHFQKKHGSDITKVPRAMARLLESAKRTKEVLSANTETVAMVESLYDDKDFMLPISRAEFEKLSADLLKRITAPIDAALKDAGLTKNQIHAFELVGGGARIPAIQAALKEHFGKELSYSLNSDEAIALGSAFHAAYLSPAFRVKSFSFKDIYPYKIDFKLSPTKEIKEEKIITLYNKNEELGLKKTINIPREEDFTVTVKYDESVAPVGVTAETSLISEHEVIGVGKQMANWTYEDDRGKKKKVRVSFDLTSSGLMKFEGAAATLEETITIRIPKKKNATATIPATKEEEKKAEAATPTEDKITEPAADDKATTEDKEEYEYKKEKKTTKVNLEVKSKILSKLQPLSDEEKLAIRTRLNGLDQYDKLKRDISAARNTLESTLYELRYQLLDDAQYKPFYTDKESANLLGKIEDTDSWLSDHDETTISKEEEQLFKDKLSAVTQLSQPIFDRFNQVDLRKKSIQKCRDVFNKTRNYAEKFKTTLTHITEEEWADLTKLAKETEEWVNTTVAKQEQTPLSQPPIALATEFEDKCSIVSARTLMLVKKPVPKPPKETKNATKAEEKQEETAETGTEETKSEELPTENDSKEQTTEKKDEL